MSCKNQCQRTSFRDVLGRPLMRPIDGSFESIHPQCRTCSQARTDDREAWRKMALKSYYEAFDRMGLDPDRPFMVVRRLRPKSANEIDLFARFEALKIKSTLLS